MDEQDQNARELLKHIEMSEQELSDVYQKHLGGPVFYQHFYLFGIARRAAFFLGFEFYET